MWYRRLNTIENISEEVLEHPNLKTSGKNVFGSNSEDLLALKWRCLEIDQSQVNNVSKMCSSQKK